MITLLLLVQVIMLELPLEIIREIVMGTSSLDDFVNMLNTCKYIRSAINYSDIDKKIKMHADFITKPINEIFTDMPHWSEFIRVQTLPNGKMHGKCIWFDRKADCTVIKIIGNFSKGNASGTWRFCQGRYSAGIVYI
jgi:hypothetical protein